MTNGKGSFSRSPEMPLGLRFPNVLGGGAGGTHVPRAVLQLANEILEVADADWSRAIWITCAGDGNEHGPPKQWRNALQCSQVTDGSTDNLTSLLNVVQLLP